MSCKIKFRVKSPEKIRIGFSVTGYKNRIVAPEIYTGETVVTAGEDEIVLQTHNKLVESDIRVNGITGVKTITENGTYDTLGDKEVTVSITPDLRPLSVSENGSYQPDGFDGYSQVSVDVPATGYDKGTLIYNGDISTKITQFSVTEMPNGQPFSFDRVVAELYFVGQGGNTAFRTYWRSDLPVTDARPYMLTLTGGAGYLSGAEGLNVNIDMSSDDTYITSEYFTSASDDASRVKGGAFRIAHDGYQKITAFAWWSYTAQAGGHIKITGYNRTS